MKNLIFFNYLSNYLLISLKMANLRPLSSITDNSTNFIFKITDWFDEDIEEDSEDSDDYFVNSNYTIHLFGNTPRNQSVHLKVIGYKPYFYVSAPETWQTNHNNFLMQKIRSDNMEIKISKQNKRDLLSIDLVTRKVVNGFTAEKDFKFLKFSFKTLKAFKTFANKNNFKNKFSYKYEIKLPPFVSKYNLKYDLYENKIEPILRFMHIADIEASNWVNIAPEKYKVVNSNESNTQIDIECHWKDIQKVSDSIVLGQGELLVASFDIECTSGDKIRFPQAENPADKVIQIGTTFHWSGRNNKEVIKMVLERKFHSCLLPKLINNIIGFLEYKEGGDIVFKHIVTLNGCDPIPGTVVESFDNEGDLLLGWASIIRKTDPDILTGYNIFGFDFKYLYKRAEMFKLVSDSEVEYKYDNYFNTLGRFKFRPCPLEENNLSSSALGQNLMYVPKMQGRVIIDLYKAIQRDHKLDEYKLDFVSKVFIGGKKDDVTPKEIFELQEGTDHDRMIVAKYCIQDNILCNRLMEKLTILPNNIGMSNVCSVPLSYLFLRGQGIKGLSQISRECYKKNYILKTQDVEKNRRDPGYEGAFVLEPEKPEYFGGDPIAVLDFASLYPSIMITDNMCLSTLVTDKKYLADPRYKFNEVSFKDIEGDTKKFIFAHKKSGEGGILPTILKNLLSQRKLTKKRMKIEGDPFQKKMLDSLQLSYKISANSIYGLMGAKTSQFYCRPVASSITARGRQHIINSKNYVEKHHLGSKCVYGDSVPGYTPIISRSCNGEISINRIEILADKFEYYLGDKEHYEFIDGLEVQSKTGFVKALRIIRHKTEKKIYRVRTSKSVIDVTEDHSLLDYNHNELKPGDVEVGKTRLLSQDFGSNSVYSTEIDIKNSWYQVGLQLCN